MKVLKYTKVKKNHAMQLVILPDDTTSTQTVHVQKRQIKIVSYYIDCVWVVEKSLYNVEFK